MGEFLLCAGFMPKNGIFEHMTNKIFPLADLSLSDTPVHSRVAVPSGRR